MPGATRVGMLLGHPTSQSKRDTGTCQSDQTNNKRRQLHRTTEAEAIEQQRYSPVSRLSSLLSLLGGSILTCIIKEAANSFLSYPSKPETAKERGEQMR